MEYSFNEDVFLTSFSARRLFIAFHSFSPNTPISFSKTVSFWDFWNSATHLLNAILKSFSPKSLNNFSKPNCLLSFKISSASLYSFKNFLNCSSFVMPLARGVPKFSSLFFKYSAALFSDFAISSSNFFLSSS